MVTLEIWHLIVGGLALFGSICGTAFAVVYAAGKAHAKLESIGATLRSIDRRLQRSEEDHLQHKETDYQHAATIQDHERRLVKLEAY